MNFKKPKVNLWEFAAKHSEKIEIATSMAAHALEKIVALIFVLLPMLLLGIIEISVNLTGVWYEAVGILLSLAILLGYLYAKTEDII